MLTQCACLWTNHPQVQEVGVLWKRCAGKEDYSCGDWEREWVPGSHRHASKGVWGRTAVGLDVVAEDVPDVPSWTRSSDRKQWQSHRDPLPSPTPLSLLYHPGVTQKSPNPSPSL